MRTQSKQLLLVLASLAVLAASWRVWAHHAFSAEFDADAPVTLRGKVTRIEWINPHAWIHVAAEQEDGTTVAWMVWLVVSLTTDNNLSN